MEIRYHGGSRTAPRQPDYISQTTNERLQYTSQESVPLEVTSSMD